MLPLLTCAVVFARAALFLHRIRTCIGTVCVLASLSPRLPGAHIFLNTNDLANALRDIYHTRTLSLIIRALSHWSRASGHQLQPSKCIVLPLWDGDYTEHVAFAESLPGFCSDDIRTSARFIGVDLAHPPRVRHSQHGRFRAHPHNAHITSMVCYRVSFFPPSDHLVRTRTVPRSLFIHLGARSHMNFCFRSVCGGQGRHEGHMFGGALAPNEDEPCSTCRFGPVRCDAQLRRLLTRSGQRRHTRASLVQAQQVHSHHARFICNIQAPASCKFGHLHNNNIFCDTCEPDPKRDMTWHCMHFVAERIIGMPEFMKSPRRRVPPSLQHRSFVCMPLQDLQRMVYRCRIWQRTHCLPLPVRLP